MRVLVGGSILLALTGGAAVVSLRARPTEAPPATPAATPAAAPTTPFTGPFALGINEGVSIPTRHLDRPGGFEKLPGELAEDAEWATKLGARLIRGHTGAFPRISMSSLVERPERLETEGDAWVRAVQAKGLEPVLMVSPWPANRTANYTDSYLPDLVAYEAYVRRVVERYDFDGVDDMPGLTAPVRYWEVDNEPDVKLNQEPRDSVHRWKPNSFCLPEEYAQVLIASARAIRAASPEARVLGGAMYRPHAPTGAAYVEALFAIPGTLDAIDILSVHTYQSNADGSVLARGIDTARAAAPGKPVWVTETSMALGEGVDEEEQGRLVAVLTGVSAVHGVERLFWHTLSDPPASAGRPDGPGASFRTNSLLRTGEDEVHSPKPAGEVYTHLAAVLATRNLNGATADGVGAAKLTDGSVLLWEGTRPVPTGGVNLRTGAALEAGATATAPAFVW